jgi:hypothetical protein
MDRGALEDLYLLGDLLGAGMAGQVLKCQNKASGAWRAVKVMDVRRLCLANPAITPSDIAREAQLMMTLNHVSIYTLCG